MKILAIGDFHGRFPKKFESLISKERIDLVISNGDYPPFFYRKLWFKHCFGKEKELWEVIGKKKYKALVTEDHNRGEEVFKKLNKLPIPVFTVLGNVDYPMDDDVSDRYLKKKKGEKWDWSEKEYLFMKKRLAKYKNIRRIDYTFARYKDFIFVGMRGHTYPGRPKSKAFKKHKKILDNLFKKFKKENKEGKLIFVSHTPPYKTKLDKISKKAPKEVAGKHFGSKLTRKIIDSNHPSLMICGHTHEAWGKDMLKRTVCVNTGAAHEGKAAIITFPETKKGKIKVKFIK